MKKYGYFTCFIMILAVFFVAGNLHAAETRTIQVTAQKYEFLPVIKVNQGDNVILEITAKDTDHGIAIDGMDIDRALPEGETVVIEFTAGEKGEYNINCTKFCGLGHFGMGGKLIVS